MLIYPLFYYLLSFAAVYIVPLSLGCGSAVFAAITMLAPSFAHFNAISFPMPRLAPVINMVRPDSFLNSNQIKYSFYYHTNKHVYIKVIKIILRYLVEDSDIKRTLPCIKKQLPLYMIFCQNHHDLTILNKIIYNYPEFVAIFIKVYIYYSIYPLR